MNKRWSKPQRRRFLEQQEIKLARKIGLDKEAVA